MPCVICANAICSAFNMFPDSSAAQGKKDGEQKPLNAEQIAFAQITQGIHW